MINAKKEAKEPHGEGFDLNEVKGSMVETIIGSYRDSSDNFSKELVATIVFSAKDYKPHVILSVTCNGVTQHFGTDTKKAIDYYNSI